jgi:hypothetical protein
MKKVKLFEQFVNEKAYRLTGGYASKGLIGKMMQAFKKEIEKIKYEGDKDSTLSAVNAVWAKWAPKEGAKIILSEVEKAVKDMEAVVFVNASIDKEWIVDEVNNLNTEGNRELFIAFPDDFVINVGFADDVDGSKFSKKLTGYLNTPIGQGSDIYGSFDDEVGGNNVEIRGGEIMSIDAK